MRLRDRAGLGMLVVLVTCLTVGCSRGPIRPTGQSSWTFAVSGDSRNCGNVVMPAIAAGVRRDSAQFYWHLGDLRAIYMVDEDYAQESRSPDAQQPASREEYLSNAWPDFTQHQIVPFGNLPFFLGIGNHETIAPKTRDQFREEFHSLLDRSEIRDRRTEDARHGVPSTASDQTFYHWRWRGVDFINLDNAVLHAFDDAQMAWLSAVIAADVRDASVKSIVVGMHEPLPYSWSEDHSMCASDAGLQSGLQAYRLLAEAQRRKPLYVLSSHSHYYLADVYDTPHWKTSSEGVLHGWIVGTAGAPRYPLPNEVAEGENAREHVYGYVLGTVDPTGHIAFAFRDVSYDDLETNRAPDTSTGILLTCGKDNPRIEVLRSRPINDHACDQHGLPK